MLADGLAEIRRIMNDMKEGEGDEVEALYFTAFVVQ